MITYETKDTHPGTLPSATIYMDGLLCLSFDHAKRCTVGVNNKVGNGHSWKFSIVDQSTRSGKPFVVQQGKAHDLSEIHIDVQGGTTGGAYVYNGSSPVSIHEIDEQRFNLESSWIDLEGPRGHNIPVKNDNQTLWPRFYINDGLFCASRLSKGTYALKDSNDTALIKPLDHIALEIVADIFLDRNPNSKIEIKLPNQTVSLENSKRYQIYITNDCDSYVGPAHTDFHLHYNAFTGAFDDSGRGKMKANKFSLVPHRSLGQIGDGYRRYSDKAPCMAVALGQTSTFN